MTCQAPLNAVYDLLVSDLVFILVQFNAGAENPSYHKMPGARMHGGLPRSFAQIRRIFTEEFTKNVRMMTIPMAIGTGVTFVLFWKLTQMGSK